VNRNYPIASRNPFLEALIHGTLQATHTAVQIINVGRLSSIIQLTTMIIQVSG